ncbi:MAG: stage II sporulation protein P [Bacilli bacterium]
MVKKQRHIKTKKKPKKKGGLIFFSLFCLSIFSAIYLTKNYNLPEINSDFLKNISLKSNYDIESKKTKKNIVTSLVKFFSLVNLDDASSILKQNYSGLVTSKDKDELLELDKIEKLSDYIKDPYPKKKSDSPLIYIYNTHQLEEYSNQNIESYSIKPNVMMASYILREKLRNYKISSLVEENNVAELLKANAWKYAASYKITKLLMTDAFNKNPTLKYFIDLHRDSIPRTLSTTIIKDKSYARLMLVVGLENPNYKDNLVLATRFDDLLKQLYPGISRGIYKKEGPRVNGVYNQDFSPNTMLIEVGGEENTIEEVFNSVEAIANILNIIIGE